MNIFSKWQIKLLKKPYLQQDTSSIAKKKILDSKRHHMFAKQHPLKTILGLSFAPFIIFFVNAIYQLSDNIITASLTNESILINGQFNNVATIAINASSIIVVPLWGIVSGIAQGGLSWFSKAQGMQSPRLMGIYNSSSIVSILVFSFIGSLIMLNIGQELLSLSLNMPKSADNALIAKKAFTYITPRLVSLPIVGLYLHGIRTLRALNVRWWSIVPYSVGVIINLLLDYVFIKWGGLGIFGSGLATSCAEIISALIVFALLIHFFKKEAKEAKLFKPQLLSIIRVIFQGLPQTINLISATILVFFTINWASQIGALGVSSATRVITILAIYPAFGFAQGTLIALGYNYGYQNYKRMHELIFWLWFIMFSYYIFLTFILVVSADSFLNILKIHETRGGKWLQIMYSTTALLAFAYPIRVYYTATHQKIKTLLVLLLISFSALPFLYLFGVYYANIELFWYAQLVGNILMTLCLTSPWILLIKRYIKLKKTKKPIYVLRLSIAKIKKEKVGA